MEFLPKFGRELVSAGAIEADKRVAKSQQAMDSGIDAQTLVVNMGNGFWRDVLLWVRANKLVSPIDERLLRVASIELPGLVSDKDSKRLLQLIKKLEGDGFKVNPDPIARPLTIIPGEWYWERAKASYANF